MKKSMLLWAAAILIAGIGLRGTSWQPQTFANDDTEAAKRNPERRMKEFSGYCLDDQMSPVTDATVFLYRVDVELHVQKQLQSVHTDSEGRFHFDPVVEVQPPASTASPPWSPQTRRRASCGREY